MYNSTKKTAAKSNKGRLRRLVGKKQQTMRRRGSSLAGLPKKLVFTKRRKGSQSSGIDQSLGIDRPSKEMMKGVLKRVEKEKSKSTPRSSRTRFASFFSSSTKPNGKFDLSVGDLEIVEISRNNNTYLPPPRPDICTRKPIDNSYGELSSIGLNFSDEEEEEEEDLVEADKKTKISLQSGVLRSLRGDKINIHELYSSDTFDEVSDEEEEEEKEEKEKEDSNEIVKKLL